MTERYPQLYRSIQGAALLLTAVAFLLPVGLYKIHAALALMLILLGGIPHGATDYVIFRNIQMPSLSRRSMVTFVVLYLLLMGLYASLWYLTAPLGLAIFLGISIFHFGQSNWNYVDFPSKVMKLTTFWLWGGWVLIFPVIFHYEAASPILADLLSVPESALTLPAWGQFVPLVLLIGIALWTVLLRITGVIGSRALRDELLNLAVLSIAFTQLPLLLGFALYFVGWHSLTSILDQIRMYRKLVDQSYNIKAYFRDVWFFSLMAIAFMSGWLFVTYQWETRIDWAFLFTFISVVTLPHMILIDQLYTQKPNENLRSMKKQSLQTGF